jgi:TRAP-type mannitol/chloroaromatic compound transport system permease small subunit
MQERYRYVVEFIIAVFFTISFLIIAVISLLDPVLAFEFVQVNPLFSWMNPITGYAVHIIGNIFFAALAIFFALDCWRKYNEYT